MKRLKPRAAVILLQDGQIALLERTRPDRHYYAFPGGGVENDETPAEAAAREAEEELGVQVDIGNMVAEVWYLGLPQYFFRAELRGGEFGTGCGKEMDSPADSERGSYLPCWRPVLDLHLLPVLPSVVARYVQAACQDGWPEHPLYLRDLPVD
jgi:8-oxo-dGTP diphosphatase